MAACCWLLQVSTCSRTLHHLSSVCTLTQHMTLQSCISQSCRQGHALTSFHTTGSALLLMFDSFVVLQTPLRLILLVLCHIYKVFCICEWPQSSGYAGTGVGHIWLYTTQDWSCRRLDGGLLRPPLACCFCDWSDLSKGPHILVAPGPISAVQCLPVPALKVLPDSKHAAFCFNACSHACTNATMTSHVKILHEHCAVCAALTGIELDKAQLDMCRTLLLFSQT